MPDAEHDAALSGEVCCPMGQYTLPNFPPGVCQATHLWPDHNDYIR
jgi:hypothetical protein